MKATRLLTCGFVQNDKNGLDSHVMLSASPGTIDGRAQSSQHWGRLLLFSVIVFVLGLLSLDVASARPAKDPMNYKLYAHNQLQDWDQFMCLVELYQRESNWNPKARNYSHHGIPQGRSQWLAKADPYAQIRWGLRYIAHRYDTPCKALAHFKREGWH